MRFIYVAFYEITTESVERNRVNYVMVPCGPMHENGMKLTYGYMDRFA